MCFSYLAKANHIPIIMYRFDTTPIIAQNVVLNHFPSPTDKQSIGHQHQFCDVQFTPDARKRVS